MSQPEDLSLDDMVNFFASQPGIKVAVVGFGPKPEIGWKACEQRFLIDGVPITEEQALQCWREGSAKFLPNAEKRCHKLAIARKRACSG